MRFRYWTLRAVPRALELTSFGVGIIVEDPESGQFRQQFRSPKDPLYSVFGIRESLNAQVDLLESLLPTSGNTALSLEFSPNASLGSTLAQASDHWNSVLQVDSPKLMDAPNIEAAVDLLYRTLVDSGQHRERFTPLRDLKRSVISTYQSFPRLRKALMGLFRL